MLVTYYRLKYLPRPMPKRRIVYKESSTRLIRSICCATPHQRASGDRSAAQDNPRIARHSPNAPCGALHFLFYHTARRLAHLQSDNSPTHTMSAIDISRLFSVEGLVVVITGGGSGLGAMMAKALALNGASKVYIIGRRKEKLDEVAKTSPHGTYPVASPRPFHFTIFFS